jgi:type IV secretory pathway ATPase VirB11/archaellum biosynthesis ATPase
MKVASRLKVDLSEEQESKLLYYLTRKIRHSILEPFMLDGNIEDIKVIRSGLNVLVVHKDCRFLGWLKTNAVFTYPRHFGRADRKVRQEGQGADKPIYQLTLLNTGFMVFGDIPESPRI